MQIIKATDKELDLVMKSRFEMLRVVNHLSDHAGFEESFQSASRDFFHNADQTTILALEDESKEVIGCASICYLTLMPTFDHPTGKRAHIMNVYTREGYRRQGIAARMLELLLDEAQKRGVTEISLDATSEGRPLYERCGFVPAAEGMVLNL